LENLLTSGSSAAADSIASYEPYECIPTLNFFCMLCVVRIGR
jgi:hypothetical protein